MTCRQPPAKDRNALPKPSNSAAAGLAASRPAIAPKSLISAPAPDAEKRCSRCRESWPADREFFSPDRKAKDGLACICKACCADHKRAVRGSPTGRAGGMTGAAAALLAAALRG